MWWPSVLPQTHLKFSQIIYTKWAEAHLKPFQTSSSYEKITFMRPTLAPPWHGLDQLRQQRLHVLVLHFLIIFQWVSNLSAQKTSVSTWTTKNNWDPFRALDQPGSWQKWRLYPLGGSNPHQGHETSTDLLHHSCHGIGIKGTWRHRIWIYYLLSSNA